MYHSEQRPPPPQHHVPPPLAMDRLAHTPQRRASPYASAAPPSGSATTMLPNLPRSPAGQADFSVSSEDQGRIYTLEVMQQPVRARMCGFGDKDRRPITPPPCIRLIVRDAATREPIDMGDIDTSYYVLTVDLWDHEARREVNLVRHSTTSPSISAATSSSYPPPPTPPPNFPYGPPMTQVHVGLAQNYTPQVPSQPNHQYNYSQPQHPSEPHSHHSTHSTSQSQPYYMPHVLTTQQPAQSYYTTPSGTPITSTHYYQQSAIGQGPLLSPQQIMPPSFDPRSAPSGMFTRNLIGSLCVSAFKLTDPDGAMGIWFILQDLSVRTEGSFRLKMNFVNVGSSNTPQTLNDSSAPVLASVFSNVFQVFSAKKFPGVIESTALSKCFATQGIKIPIRKDGPRLGGPGGRGGDDDDD